MTNIIYVVTAGQYSEYHIMAVFTSQHVADKYVETVNGGGDVYAEVEEWEVDVLAPAVRGNLKPYLVQIKVESADVEKVVHTHWFRWGQEPSVSIASLYPQTMIVRCYAKDEQHAAKIAMEKRAEWLANE